MFQVSFAIIVILLAYTSNAFKEQTYNEKEALKNAWYSASVYCDSQSIKNWSCTPCKQNPNFVVTEVVESNLAGVLGYVGVDKAAQERLRGTDPDIVQNDVEDLLSAVLVPYDIWIGAAVGVGFLTAYTSISSPLHKVVKSVVEQYPDFNITVTGHSLGAALATIAAVDIFVAKNISTESVTLMTFGSPRVGNILFSEYAEKNLGNVWRITHAADIIVHLPLMTLGFYHLGPEVWYTKSSELMEPPGPYIICNGGENFTCSDSVKVWSVPDHRSYLGIPISMAC